jgi:hypothetical protein
VAGKSIGHTSVVFKLTLDDGSKCAFKPASRRGPLRYKGEIAAYRLGVALGLEANMPRALFRRFPAAQLKGLGLGPLFEQEVIVRDDAVTGAVLPWIDTLEFVPFESEPMRSKWRGWLKKGANIADDDRVAARDMSTLVVFDYVTGNWDRWSGANIGRDKATGRLLFMDNDGAFYEAPPPAALARQIEILRGIERFSASFVKALGDVKIDDAIGDEEPGVPLLSARALAGVETRRTRALEILATKTLDFD